MKFLELSMLDVRTGAVSKGLLNPLLVAKVFPRLFNTPGLGDVNGSVVQQGSAVYNVLESPERIQKLIETSTKDTKNYYKLGLFECEAP